MDELEYILDGKIEEEFDIKSKGSKEAKDELLQDELNNSMEYKDDEVDRVTFAGDDEN